MKTIGRRTQYEDKDYEHKFKSPAQVAVDLARRMTAKDEEDTKLETKKAANAIPKN